MEAARTDKELIEATKPYAKEDRMRSWWAFINTFSLMALTLLVAFRSPEPIALTESLIIPVGVGWALRTLATVASGLLIVRGFILFHDFNHTAIFRRSKFARAFFWLYGVLVMTPPRVWRETHNYHHANTAKLVGSHVGSYAMVSTAMWDKMSERERRMYKIIRHPLTIAFGYFTIFMYGMCISAFLRKPRKHWVALLSVLVNWAIAIAVLATLGVVPLLFGYFIPMVIATACGAYLFYAQHNFPGMNVQPRESWNFTKAALESSSFMKMGAMMNYFTGNIGYHHVHHLNASIPFYRLPEAMEAIPELADAPTTTLKVSDIVACFDQKLWDSEKHVMVGYPARSRERETSLAG